MNLENRSIFYIASIVVINAPLSYIVSTNAGVSVYHSWDELPTLVKAYVSEYSARSTSIGNHVAVISKV